MASSSGVNVGRRSRVAPVTDKMIKFTVVGTNGRPQPVWYVPPGHPFLNQSSDYRHRIDIGAGTGNWRVLDQNPDTRRVHANNFGQRRFPDWFRLIEFGKRNGSKKPTRLVKPTRIWRLQDGELRDQSIYDYVPLGSGLLMKTDRVFHSTPSPNLGNAEREVRASGMLLPRKNAFRMGHYIPAQNRSSSRESSNDNEKSTNVHKGVRKRPIPPPHTFRRNSIVKYSKRQRNR